MSASSLLFPPSQETAAQTKQAQQQKQEPTRTESPVRKDSSVGDKKDFKAHLKEARDQRVSSRESRKTPRAETGAQEAQVSGSAVAYALGTLVASAKSEPVTALVDEAQASVPGRFDPDLLLSGLFETVEQTAEDSLADVANALLGVAEEGDAQMEEKTPDLFSTGFSVEKFMQFLRDTFPPDEAKKIMDVVRSVLSPEQAKQFLAAAREIFPQIDEQTVDTLGEAAASFLTVGDYDQKMEKVAALLESLQKTGKPQNGALGDFLAKLAGLLAPEKELIPDDSQVEKTPEQSEARPLWAFGAGAEKAENAEKNEKVEKQSQTDSTNGSELPKIEQVSQRSGTDSKHDRHEGRQESSRMSESNALLDEAKGSRTQGSDSMRSTFAENLGALRASAEAPTGQANPAQPAAPLPAAPYAYPLLSENRFGEGMLNMLQVVRSQGVTEARMIVEPPALGQIAVSLQMTSSGMDATLRVDNENLKQMVQAQIDQLKASLEAQGIHVMNLEVDIRSQDERKEAFFGKKGKRTRGIDGVDGDETDENVAMQMRLDLENGVLHWLA